jgi:hypothetical protein
MQISYLLIDVVCLGEAHSGELFKGQLVLLAGLSRELSLVDPSSSDGGHTHAVTDEDYYVLGVTKYVLGKGGREFIIHCRNRAEGKKRPNNMTGSRPP